MSSIATRFLRRVWKAQPHAGFAFLSYFDDSQSWVDESLAPSRLPSDLPAEGLNVYFAPCIFDAPKRRKQHALGGVWLYADLDEVNPKSLTDCIPTIAWTTSRDRYQALWLLDKSLAPDTLERLNQRLTYYTKADKGGWSRTKVLRVPGSVSTKHGYNHLIKILWDDGPSYAPKTLALLTRKSAPSRTSSNGSAPASGPKLPKVTPSALLRRRKPPARARKLYKAKEARGDRSARLWELECLLLKAGCTPEETLVIVKPTVWNKYAGQDREVAQLWQEIQKAAHQIPRPRKTRSSRKRSKTAGKNSTRSRSAPKNSDQGTKSSSRSAKSEKRSKAQSSRSKRSRSKERYSGSSYNKLLAKPLKKPDWLVEGVWSENAHGVLAGEAKTYKSVISTDLAISVASGTPFLNSFKIPQTGPVIIVQEENDEGEFQDRLRRIAFSRGLLGEAKMRGNNLSVTPDTELPITIYNNQGFDLTDPDTYRFLRKKCKELNPSLLILDPFYLMTPGVDENSASQVTPILEQLMRLKQKTGVGIQLIHHYKKQNTVNPIYGAARMSGTGVFHRWFESAVYVERLQKEPYTVRLVPDHRGHAPQGAITVSFDLGTDLDLHYKVYVSRKRADKAELHVRLQTLLAEKDEWSVSELRLAMGLNSTRTIKEMITQHGYTLLKRKTKRGRPRMIVVKDAHYE